MALIEIILLIIDDFIRSLAGFLNLILMGTPMLSQLEKSGISALKKSHIRLWQSEQVMPNGLPVLIYFEGKFPIFCDGRKGYSSLDKEKETHSSMNPTAW